MSNNEAQLEVFLDAVRRLSPSDLRDLAAAVNYDRFLSSWLNEKGVLGLGVARTAGTSGEWYMSGAERGSAAVPLPREGQDREMRRVRVMLSRVAGVIAVRYYMSAESFERITAPVLRFLSPTGLLDTVPVAGIEWEK